MKRKQEESAFWAGRERRAVAEGELRLLSAREILELRRESEELAMDGTERALCSNACLIARALERGGLPVYPDGQAVLEALRVEDIVRLADAWGEFNKTCNPSPMDGSEEIERRKKVWSTRLTRAFNGVCSALSARCPLRNGPNK